MSIPLQQTARYLREHFEELTEEEAKILQKGFLVSLEEVVQIYNPECVDWVKEQFQPHLDSDYLQSYFKVWFQQLLKHPDTYAQAFLNQNYRYLYPGERDYLYGRLVTTAILFMVELDQIHDGYVDFSFIPSDSRGREILRHFYYMMEEMPILSMFLSASLHIYAFLGELAYLLAKKRRREILFLVPMLFILLLRLFSPVANVRYIMPIMAAQPVTAAWCYVAAHREDLKMQG